MKDVGRTRSRNPGHRIHLRLVVKPHGLADADWSWPEQRLVLAGTGTLLLLSLATRPLGGYLKRVFDGQAADLDNWPRRHAAIVARFTAAA